MNRPATATQDNSVWGNILCAVYRKEKDMPSKSKEARLDQKTRLEDQLSQRLAELAEKGYESVRIAKDTKVKMIRADLRKTTARLSVISAKQKKLEEMSEAKKKKVVAPKAEKSKKKKPTPEETSVSKRQQKKREKKEKKQSEAGAEG